MTESAASETEAPPPTKDLAVFFLKLGTVAIAGPCVRKLRASKLMGALLDYMNVASLALMAYVTCELARGAITDGRSLALAIAGAVILLTLRINSTCLVAAGAALGVVFSRQDSNVAGNSVHPFKEWVTIACACSTIIARCFSSTKLSAYTL